MGRHGGYGWVRDTHDHRDYAYGAPGTFLTNLPAAVDLSTDPAMPPVWDQGQLGSCTAHGTLAAFLWASAKGNVGDPMLSRLQLYWNTRSLEGTTAQDAGGQIRDAIKATAVGIAPEDAWPYDIARFAVAPSAEVIQAGRDNVGVQYARVDQDLTHMRACLADGYPIVIGFTVYESFESSDVAESGQVPMPADGEEVLGGHCVAIVGYDDARQTFKIRNSWGTGWGAAGYCWMPYAFLTDPNFASDFWTIRKVT